MIDRLAVRIWNYLNYSARPSEKRAVLEGLAQVSAQDIDRLLSQRIVSNEKVSDFVNLLVPQLLREFSKSSTAVTDKGLGLIRGRIDWAHTRTVRAQEGPSSATFVWQSRRGLYDLPVNQLIKFALRQVRILAYRAVGKPAVISSVAQTWYDTAMTLAVQADLHLGHVLMKSVTDVASIDPRTWQQCFGHRSEDYRNAAAFLSWLLTAQVRSTRLSLDILASSYLFPLSPDTLFELFVLSKVIDALIAEGWALREVRAIGGQPAPIFRLVKGVDDQCAVFYQHTPEILREASGYLRMFRGTGIDGSLRRPDVVVLIESGRARWLGIIEAKRTASRAYISDGIYKCLGYLRDFQPVLDAQHPPRALLVAWGGIPPQRFEPLQDVNVVTAHRLTQSLRPFLAAGAAH